eukprot:scaffold53954_cov18-Tisochrysis_lutea.AAC.2
MHDPCVPWSKLSLRQNHFGAMPRPKTSPEPPTWCQRSRGPGALQWSLQFQTVPRLFALDKARLKTRRTSVGPTIPDCTSPLALDKARLKSRHTLEEPTIPN